MICGLPVNVLRSCRFSVVFLLFFVEGRWSLIRFERQIDRGYVNLIIILSFQRSFNLSFVEDERVCFQQLRKSSDEMNTWNQAIKIVECEIFRKLFFDHRCDVSANCISKLQFDGISLRQPHAPQLRK